jgi:hypothetical protein
MTFCFVASHTFCFVASVSALLHHCLAFCITFPCLFVLSSCLKNHSYKFQAMEVCTCSKCSIHSFAHPDGTQVNGQLISKRNLLKHAKLDQNKLIPAVSNPEPSVFSNDSFKTSSTTSSDSIPFQLTPSSVLILYHVSI